MADRNYEVIVWGATGFTGKLVAEYLLKQYGIGEQLNWAIAGRNQTKLEQVRSDLGAESLPIIVADSQDKTSLSAMVEQTKVICTTVGPYAKYGDLLVECCVEQGVNYCDLTGEVQWMRRTIDQHHETAQKNKAKIVHCCGFDSIPSDMGVYFLQKQAQEKWQSYAQQVKFRLKAASGGFSGGTLASLDNVLLEVAQNPSLQSEVIDNPYGLNPRNAQEGNDVKDLETALYDEDFKAWVSPFVMATINTKVVRRSHALAGFPYGKDFLYEEATLSGEGLFGRFSANTMAFVMGAMTAPNSILKSFAKPFLPKPGQGPSKQQRESGFFKVLLLGKSQDGAKQITIKVTGDKDPGYGSTSKMLAESAVCLAKDQAQLPDNFGVITPSTAMGDALLERLQANAGLEFSLIEA